MTCSQCGAALPVGFPGAAVTCACGATVALPAAPPPMRAATGPYRAASAVRDEAASFACPFCGHACPALARVCPHCDVRLENVRCGRCFTLQPPGHFRCIRCDVPLELQPMLDATNAPCPRCQTALEAPDGARDARVHECPRCDGVFVPRDVLAELLVKAETEGPFVEPEPRTIRPLEEVRYLACPACHDSMNRLNFGRVSGVIVDVCRAHGTWFDGGELTRVIAFAATGGLEKTRAREAAEKKELAQRRRAAHVEAGAFRIEERERARLDMWQQILRDLFLW